MQRIGLASGLVIVLLAPAMAQTTQVPESYPAGAPRKGAFAVDAGGRRIRALESGSTLHVGARGLRANTTYEFRLALGRPARTLREAVSFARVTTDRRGDVPPFVLWYESGVIGCPDRREAAPTRRRPHTYRTFEEAERELGGRSLAVTAHAVQRDESGKMPPMKLRVRGVPEAGFRLPIRARRSPMIYPSDAQGCLRNSQLTGDRDLYVSGRNFRPGQLVEIAVVPNQRLWFVGDVINDATGASFAAAFERVTVDSSGRFTVKAWDAQGQRPGVYDIVAHRPGSQAEQVRRVLADDIISFAAETGFILYSLYPIGGPTMDIAGRPISGSPYFEFADSFAETGDPVWGAVDPTYVPVAHPGGTYAAYFVVSHRDVAGWNPAMGGSTSLVDVSGSIEIHPVKAGCINGTDVIIWSSPLTVGQYDAVVDFGSNPAATPGDYVPDGNYNDTVDFLDGAEQIGFVAARDPYELGPLSIGQDSYTQDDFFPTLGGASDVDLRAVVRYPATAAGVGTPVAPGGHPLFLIEHGNHTFCNACGYLHPTCPSCGGCGITHANCPDRELNHMGYMRLLEILASHGIIAVSIDAYDLTGPVSSWIEERGTLILKHIELWSHMNDTTTFTSYPDFFAGRFAGHVDLSRISVSGHSRGGEASVAAYMLNTLFSINSVSSIAPVDNLIYVLPDVPYFVMIPAADGDVWDLDGVGIYDRAGTGLPGGDGSLKSGIDVYGASHNFFNTVWAADWDDGSPGRDDYIPAADQQRLGEAYLAAFARTHLKNETVYLDMLRGKLTFPSFAGRKIYPFHHEKSHSKIENGSIAGAVASGGAVIASQIPPALVHEAPAMKVNWSSSTAQVAYTVPVAQQDVSGFEVLSFRVAQTNSGVNPAMGNQDLQVELVGGGNTKATFVGRFGDIPKPYKHDGFTGQYVMTTIRIPLHSFIMNNSGVTLNDIDTVRFKFLSPTQGEIYVDDVEFSR